MLTSTNTAFANAMRKLVTALQPWSKRSVVDADLPAFDTESERQFWLDRQSEALVTLKSILVLSCSAFLVFIILDWFNNSLSQDEFWARLAVFVAYLLLFFHLHNHENAQSQVSKVVKIAAFIYVANLIIILLTNHQSLFYVEPWTGLLPIYFFLYGQLFLTVLDTVLFGWLAMFLLLMIILVTGTSIATLIPSILILFIANIFGFCTRYQLEKQYRLTYKAKFDAIAAGMEKSLFLQQLSHNLRQPLQALSSYTCILDTACTGVNEQQLPQLVSKIGNTVDELNKAFNHILSIANLESGKQLPFLKSVDINLILSTIEDQFSAEAAKRNLKLKVNLRQHPPYNIYTDACMLTQIISNLIDNAIKYTNQGWILVSTAKTPDGLKLHVIDTGIGITDHDRPSIFKEFYRGSWYRRLNDRNVSGHGIGLTYVQKALKTLPGHELSFNSKVNKGSDFQLLLPITSQSARFLPTAPAHLFGAHIYIIYDNRTVLTALAEQLDQHGGIVHTARSKTEMLEKLAIMPIPPDLIISDFYLEDNETALDIIAVANQCWGSVPILIFSAHALKDEDRAKLPNNTGLLRKPANNALLLDKIIHILASHQQFDA